MAAAFQAEGGFVACVLPGILLQSGNADFRKRVVIIARDSLGHLADLLSDARDVARQAFYAGFLCVTTNMAFEFVTSLPHLSVACALGCASYVATYVLMGVWHTPQKPGVLCHVQKTNARQHHNRNDDTRYQRFFALLAARVYAVRRRSHGVLLLSRFK